VELLENVEATVKEVEALVERDYSLVSKDLQGLNSRFYNLMKEYEELSLNALKGFGEAVGELKEGRLLSGGVKLVKSVVMGGVAWWKKRQWFNRFFSSLEQLHASRLALVEEKLKAVEEVEREHLPYIREQIDSLLKALSTFPEFEDPSLRERAVNTGETTLLLLLKSYYIEAVALFLKGVYEDVKRGVVVAGNVDSLKLGLLQGIDRVKEKVLSMELPPGSPLYEALRRNAVFGVEDEQD
jgi:hypothetical protein